MQLTESMALGVGICIAEYAAQNKRNHAWKNGLRLIKLLLVFPVR